MSEIAAEMSLETAALRTRFSSDYAVVCLALFGSDYRRKEKTEALELLTGILHRATQSDYFIASLYKEKLAP